MDLSIYNRMRILKEKIDRNNILKESLDDDITIKLIEPYLLDIEVCFGATLDELVKAECSIVDGSVFYLSDEIICYLMCVDSISRYYNLHLDGDKLLALSKIVGNLFDICSERFLGMMLFLYDSSPHDAPLMELDIPEYLFITDLRLAFAFYNEIACTDIDKEFYTSCVSYFVQALYVKFNSILSDIADRNSDRLDPSSVHTWMCDDKLYYNIDASRLINSYCEDNDFKIIAFFEKDNGFDIYDLHRTLKRFTILR